MKAIVSKFSKDQKDEIWRICKEHIREGVKDACLDVDALWLLAVSQEFGFGQKRLERLYDKVYALRQEYIEFTGSDGYDGMVEIGCRKALHDIGCDIEEMHKDKPYLIDCSFSTRYEESKSMPRRDKK